MRVVVVLVVLGLASLVEAAEPLAISLPLPHSVTQRREFVLAKSNEHEAGGPRRGVGRVAVEVALPESAGEERAAVGVAAEYRVIALEKAWGVDSDWALLEGSVAEQTFRGVAEIAAGGWYRLEVRLTQTRQRPGAVEVAAIGAVEPIGVGEVFVIAGQSYATNCNDAILSVTEPAGRVVAFDTQTSVWRVANDPQPVVDGSNRGSIWPPAGDLLAGVLHVPVGFVNVAVGGSASSQWLPGTPFCNRLIEAGKRTGAFRAVLWQQGESDVLGNMSTEAYAANIRLIRNATVEGWKNGPTPWLLAKSTLHPTVYNTPEGEGRIRAGIDLLCREAGFRPGPDTDLLAGENRGPLGTMQHFTELGQRRAAALWFAAILAELGR